MILGNTIYLIAGITKFAVQFFEEVIDSFSKLINVGKQARANLNKSPKIEFNKYYAGKNLIYNTPYIQVIIKNDTPSIRNYQLLSVNQSELDIAKTAIRDEATDLALLKIENELAGISNPAIGRGSTGRTVANNLQEQIGMKKIWASDDLSIPDKNISAIDSPLNPADYLKNDTRWLGSEGWRKYSKTIEYKGPSGYNLRKEIHYNFNINTGQVDDFKFKDTK